MGKDTGVLISHGCIVRMINVGMAATVNADNVVTTPPECVSAAAPFASSSIEASKKRCCTALKGWVPSAGDVEIELKSCEMDFTRSPFPRPILSFVSLLVLE